MSHVKSLEEVDYGEYVRIKVKQHLRIFPDKAFTLLDLMIQVFDFPVHRVNEKWDKGLNEEDSRDYRNFREIINHMAIYQKDQIKMKKVGKKDYYYIDSKAI